MGKLARRQPTQGTRARPGYAHARGFAAGVTHASSLSAGPFFLHQLLLEPLLVQRHISCAATVIQDGVF